MARSARDLLHEALELPLADRAKMAADLLDSLHDTEAMSKRHGLTRSAGEFRRSAMVTSRAPTGRWFSTASRRMCSAVEAAKDYSTGRVGVSQRNSVVSRSRPTGCLPPYDRSSEALETDRDVSADRRSSLWYQRSRCSLIASEPARPEPACRSRRGPRRARV